MSSRRIADLLFVASLAVGLVGIGLLTLIWSGAFSPRAAEPTPAGVSPTAAGGATPRVADTPSPSPSATRPAPTVAAAASPSPTPDGRPAAGAAAPSPSAARTSPPAASSPTPAMVAGEDPRVETALRELRTDAERVGHLLLLGWEGTSADDARAMLRELRPGGVVFIANARTRADASAINAGLVRAADDLGLARPLLAVDHEGGLVQRIQDVPNLGSNLQFAGRRPSEREACERGLAHAEQLRAMGFNMNLAPVLDVNNNPANPVIGSRSYGADPELVAVLGSAYARGLRGAGIAAVGKHFPGHGNTAVDSHLGLPVQPQTQAQLGQVELVPFRRAIAPPTDIAAIMSAHIALPAVDSSGAPATLSSRIMTGLLRQQLGFGGLAVSDDLGAMRAITDNFAPGEAAIQSVRAGVDLLIIGGDLARQRASRDALLGALASGQLTRDRVDEAVRRVLRVKARFGLLGEPRPAERGCG